jgi:hypothetical protein
MHMLRRSITATTALCFRRRLRATMVHWSFVFTQQILMAVVVLIVGSDSDLLSCGRLCVVPVIMYSENGVAIMSYRLLYSVYCLYCKS